jgi:hypothetical protein
MTPGKPAIARLPRPARAGTRVRRTPLRPRQ